LYAAKIIAYFRRASTRFRPASPSTTGAIKHGDMATTGALGFALSGPNLPHRIKEAFYEDADLPLPRASVLPPAI